MWFFMHEATLSLLKNKFVMKVLALFRNFDYVVLFSTGFMLIDQMSKE